jgi:hypothetical protein
VDVYREIALEQSIIQNVKISIESIFVDYLNARYNATMVKSKKNKEHKDFLTLDEKIEVVSLHFK